MKMTKIIGIFFGLALICSNSIADIKTLTIGIYDWKPFISQQMENHGLLAEIASEALAKMGYNVEFKSYPFPRLLINLADGTIDMSLAISEREERKHLIDFSSSLYELEQGFTFKKGKIDYKVDSDLKKHKGGILRGSFWADDLDSMDVRYEEVPTRILNIKKLVADRIDFVCMPKVIAFNMLKEIGEDVRNYDFKLLKIEKQPAGFSKKAKFRELRDDFEKGLEIIKSDGTYDKIISKFNNHP